MAKINEIFKPLYTSDKRYYLLTGGRGSLKSSTTHDFIARLSFEKGHGILFTRYTMKSAETSIIPEFKKTLDRNGMTGMFHVTKNKAVNLLTGSFILFSGIKTSSGDQTANLKSISGITTWVIEEGEDFTDEKAFDTIDDSIRESGIQNRVIWIQNPSTREHFIYKRFIESNNKQIDVEGFKVTVSNDPKVEHIHTTYRIAEKNGYLNESFLDKANSAKEKVDKLASKEDKEAKKQEVKQNSWYYHNYIGGWLEKAEGVIITNWEEGEFNDTLPYVYGLDFGVEDPDAMVKIAVDKKRKKIYVDEMHYENGSSSEELIKAISQFATKDELILADYGEKRSILNLQDAGYNAVNCYKDKIKDRIKNTRSYTFIVTPRSHNVKREFNLWAWNDKRSDTPKDENNHSIDAIFYGYNEFHYKQEAFFG